MITIVAESHISTQVVILYSTCNIIFLQFHTSLGHKISVQVSFLKPFYELKTEEEFFWKQVDKYELFDEK